jgi:hypothetical protein
MMRKLAVVSFVLGVFVGVAACGGDEDGDNDDNAPEGKTLEGDELTAYLAAPPVEQVQLGFRRMGFLWDATEDGALEVRTSLDGATWSDWAAPTVVTVEDVAHGGHVDAMVVGDDGSTADDPLAHYYQLRVGAGHAAPTFIDIEPLLDIPALIDPTETVPDTADADDGDPNLYSFVLSTGIGGLRVYSRADWGARAPRCYGGANSPNRATIHHTVTPTNDSLSPQARLRQIQSFHMFTRGWCDIGYNHLVSRDGRVWRGRGVATVGAHVTNNNTGNEGISFMGTYTSTAPTQAQMCSAAKLLRWVHENYPAVSLTRTDIKGHRQYGGTSCPGTALYNRIDDIIRKAKSGCDAN